MFLNRKLAKVHLLTVHIGRHILVLNFISGFKKGRLPPKLWNYNRFKPIYFSWGLQERKLSDIGYYNNKYLMIDIVPFRLEWIRHPKNIQRHWAALCRKQNKPKSFFHVKLFGRLKEGEKMQQKMKQVRNVLEDHLIAHDILFADSSRDMFYRGKNNAKVKKLADMFKHGMLVDSKFKTEFVKRIKQLKTDYAVKDIYRTGTFSAYLGFARGIEDSEVNEQIIKLGYELKDFPMAQSLISFFAEDLGIITGMDILQMVHNELNDLRDMLLRGVPLKRSPEIEDLAKKLADRIRKETTKENPIFGEMPEGN